jgi:hypothetical protein
VIKSIAVKCQTCIIGAVGHYQAAETGLLIHLSTVWSLAVIQIQCVYVHGGGVYRPEAPQTLPPTPFWTAETQVYADFGSGTDIRCSLYKFPQPEPFIMRCLCTCESANRKSQAHEHMAMVSELTPRAINVGGILTQDETLA